MATRATAATPAIQVARRHRARRVGDRLAGYALSTPAIALLLVFFLVPIYFVVRFSFGLEQFAQTEAAAELTGELAGFSTELWANFFGPGVSLYVSTRGLVFGGQPCLQCSCRSGLSGWGPKVTNGPPFSLERRAGPKARP